MAKAFEIDDEKICAGCVYENSVVGFTRVIVDDDALCEWCGANHKDLELAVRSQW